MDGRDNGLTSDQGHIFEQLMRTQIEPGPDYLDCSERSSSSDDDSGERGSQDQE